jgi:hypothetical protein
MALEGRQQHRHLEAEADGDGLLRLGTSGHGRVPVAFGERGQRSGNCRQVLLHQLQGIANLQHGCGVDDVLRGRAPMAPLTQTAGAKPYQLLHHGKHGMADGIDLLLQSHHVNLLDQAVTADFFRRLLGNDSQARLHAGKRPLDVEIVLNAAFIGKNGAHGRAAEEIAKEGGVDDGGRHVCSSLKFVSRGFRPGYDAWFPSLGKPTCFRN